MTSGSKTRKEHRATRSFSDSVLKAKKKKKSLQSSKKKPDFRGNS